MSTGGLSLAFLFSASFSRPARKKEVEPTGFRPAEAVAAVGVGRKVQNVSLKKRTFPPSRALEKCFVSILAFSGFAPGRVKHW